MTKISQIGQENCDYSTIAAWEADMQGNLTMDLPLVEDDPIILEAKCKVEGKEKK